jgi:predicted Zn-dependent protease
MLGRNRESLEQINKAQELDPSSQAILADKGEILVSAGRKEEGIALLREVERADPEFRSPMPTSLLSPSISGTIQPTWRRAQRRRGL